MWAPLAPGGVYLVVTTQTLILAQSARNIRIYQQILSVKLLMEPLHASLAATKNSIRQGEGRFVLRGTITQGHLVIE